MKLLILAGPSSSQATYYRQHQRIQLFTASMWKAFWTPWESRHAWQSKGVVCGPDFCGHLLLSTLHLKALTFLANITYLA